LARHVIADKETLRAAALWAAFTWLADEQTQRDMQRREEVNINHSHRHDEQDDVEIGGNF
ncbi:hypothetical protein JTM61_37380, partial [Pseudomonas aeruginosa]|nr:hypothetical protein [Pseudomonas aeruginosa]